MTDDPRPVEESPSETPAEALDLLSRALEAVGKRGVAGSVEYDRAGIVFAILAPDAVSFRLLEEVVAAALRTPGTALSTRGPDWISLETATADQFTLDRAVSWFESAWRLAGQNTTPA
jgi:hypothetical protein